MELYKQCACAAVKNVCQICMSNICKYIWLLHLLATPLLLLPIRNTQRKQNYEWEHSKEYAVLLECSSLNLNVNFNTVYGQRLTAQTGGRLSKAGHFLGVMLEMPIIVKLILT